MTVVSGTLTLDRQGSWSLVLTSGIVAMQNRGLSQSTLQNVEERGSPRSTTSWGAVDSC